MIYKTRSEHDFYKMLAKEMSDLESLIKGQKEAIEKLKDMIGLIDGYFLSSKERVRNDDDSWT